jgi:hypothetical protein
MNKRVTYYLGENVYLNNTKIAVELTARKKQMTPKKFLSYFLVPAYEKSIRG